MGDDATGWNGGTFWKCGLAGVAAAGAIRGFLVEPEKLEVHRYPIEIPGLPERLEGWVLAHVSDLHLGRVRGAHRKLLEALDRHEPDLILCTGDLLENTGSFEVFVRYARELVDRAPQIVSVWGNWEYHRNTPEAVSTALDAYDEAGIPVLFNEWYEFEEGIAVAGADDPHRGDYDPEALFDASPKAPVRLFLMHAPGELDDAPAYAPEFDLTLAGHTHGGQVRLGSFAPITPPGSGRFTDGFYETDYGRTYVSRGVGMTRLRVRFSCLPELPIFELRRA